MQHNYLGLDENLVYTLVLLIRVYDKLLSTRKAIRLFRWWYPRETEKLFVSCARESTGGNSIIRDAAVECQSRVSTARALYLYRRMWIYGYEMKKRIWESEITSTKIVTEREECAHLFPSHLKVWKILRLFVVANFLCAYVVVSHLCVDTYNHSIYFRHRNSLRPFNRRMDLLLMVLRKIRQNLADNNIQSLYYLRLQQPKISITCEI